MDQELQKYYENRFGMMGSDGWNQFLEDLEAIKNTITIEGLSSAEQLWFAKGQLDIIGWVLSLKDASEKAYEDLTNA
jgi:hypothetical protein